MSMSVELSYQSDLGKVRDNNEDTIVSNPEQGIFVVCDGFGEGRCGKIASTISAKTIIEYFEHDNVNNEIPLNFDINSDASFLVTAIHLANLRLYNFVDRFIDYYGMGSTIAALYLKGGNAYIGHVGDSRVYRLRDNRLELLTHDHSYVNELIRMGRIKQDEAHRYVNKHFITRSLGMAETVRVDLNIIEVKKDDMFLLCSDGLNHMVQDEEIQDVISTYRADLSETCKNLIKRANDSGGEDDISVVTLRVKDMHAPPSDQSQKKGVVYLPDPEPDIVSLENKLLEKIFGENLYPREIQVS